MIGYVPAIPNTFPPQPNLPLVPDYASIQPDKVCISQNGTLPPEAFLDIRRDVNKDSLSNENITSVVGGSLLMCAYGRLLYTDNFGRDKETRVCYVYDFGSGIPDVTDGEDIFDSPSFRKAGTEAYNKTT